MSGEHDTNPAKLFKSGGYFPFIIIITTMEAVQACAGQHLLSLSLSDLQICALHSHTDSFPLTQLHPGGKPHEQHQHKPPTCHKGYFFVGVREDFRVCICPSVTLSLSPPPLTSRAYREATVSAPGVRPSYPGGAAFRSRR